MAEDTIDAIVKPFIEVKTNESKINNCKDNFKNRKTKSKGAKRQKQGNKCYEMDDKAEAETGNTIQKKSEISLEITNQIPNSNKQVDNSALTETSTKVNTDTTFQDDNSRSIEIKKNNIDMQSKLNNDETKNPVQIEQNSTLIKTASKNYTENAFISQNQSLLLPDSSTPIVGSSTKKKKKGKEPKMNTTNSQNVIQTEKISNAIKIPLQKQNEASFTVMSPPQNSPDSSILFNIVSSNRKKKKKKRKKSNLDRTEKQSNSIGTLWNDDTVHQSW